MATTFGYVRVSTAKQKLERQYDSIKEAFPDIDDKDIFADKYTGTKMDRPEFETLCGKVKPGDTIVFDSVSRMSRNADEGIEQYFKWYNAGINLVFLNERHIDTDAYRKAIDVAVDNFGQKNDAENKKCAERFIDAIMKAIKDFMIEKASDDIRKAFEQAQKEVDDLHTRVKRGIKVVMEKNATLPEDERTQIGRKAGTTFETQKSLEAKKLIRKYHREFNGTMRDSEILDKLKKKMGGISRNTLYKYKAELKEEKQQ